MKKGVTLLELIIVIVVASVIAAVALPSYLKARAKAENDEMLANMRGLRGAVLSYRMDTGVWPTCADATAVNTVLHAKLLTAGNIWSYQTKASGVICAQHTTDATRQWFMNVAAGDEESTAGACP